MNQCQCVTAKGTQCSHRPSIGSKFCLQHQNCLNIISPDKSTTTAKAANAVTTAVKAPPIPPPMSKRSTVVKAFPILPPMTIAKGVTIKPPPIPPSMSKRATTVAPKVSGLSKTSLLKTVKKAVFDVPSANEIVLINKILAKINALAEEQNVNEYFVDDDTMEPYKLTMDDVQKINDNPSAFVFLIEPQMYSEIIKFGDDTTMFYDYAGKAVTGSGADYWILYKPGLIDTLRKILESYQPLPKKNVATKRNLIGTGNDMFVRSSTLLDEPEGRRLTALRATNNSFNTDLSTRSGLCKDVLSDMYKDELLDLAVELDLPVSNKTSKADLCEMITNLANDIYTLSHPQTDDLVEAEKILQGLIQVSAEEAAANMEKLQGFSWIMGNPVDNTSKYDPIISNETIIIDWINPSGEDEELILKGPVSYRNVFRAINDSLDRFAKTEGIEYIEDVLGDHVFFEGLYPVKGKPGHFSASFGS